MGSGDDILREIERLREEREFLLSFLNAAAALSSNGRVRELEDELNRLKGEVQRIREEISRLEARLRWDKEDLEVLESVGGP